MRRLALGLPLIALTVLASVNPPAAASSLDRADAALVLSGDVDGLRVARAAELFAAGKVRFLLLTGAGVGGDDAHWLADEAEKRGVPRGAMLLEERSHSTRENLAFSAPLLRSRNLRRIALVTSASHMARASRVARALMPDVEWLPVAVPDAGPWPRVIRTRLAEWAKLAGYAARGWL